MAKVLGIDLGTTNWTDVAAAAILNNANLKNELRLSSGYSNQFFRLKH